MDYLVMTKIERFEDLLSWQKGRCLANAVYQLTLQGSFVKDFGLRDQILRASGSVMHNIAEGFDAGSNPEMIRFLKIARRSASEVQSELYLALDRKHINAVQLYEAYSLAVEVKRLINGLVGYLRQDTDRSSPKSLKESLSEYTLSNSKEPISYFEIPTELPD
jgi:four helix bundle protein